MCRGHLLLCLFLCAHGFSVCWSQLECAAQDETVYCRGARALRNMLRNLNKSAKPLVIMRGLEIVPLPNETHRGAAILEEPQDDPTLLESLALYLRTHEINLKLADLLADEDMRRSGLDVSEARKKDKGQGLLLAMALMFGKMMAVLGLGGIGALAFKALGVAMVALMMAGMLGLKSATQHGNESSHSISYLTAEGHHHKRRRRAATRTQVVTEQQKKPLDMAYRGWL